MLKEVVDCWEHPRDLIIKTYNIEKYFLNVLRIKSEWSQESINSLSKDTIVWNMEGFKTEEGTGVIGQGTRYSKAMGKFTNISKAEIYMCVEMNLDSLYKSKNIEILSVKLISTRWAPQPLV